MIRCGENQNGTAANVFGATLPQAARTRRPLRHRLIAAGERACERKADAEGEQEFNASGDMATSPTQNRGPAFANWAGRHSILKEG